MTWSWLWGKLFLIDWLGWYGAIVATIALIYSYRKMSRKIRVISDVDSLSDINMERLNEPPEKPYFSPKSIIGPLYKITVINISYNPVHILEAGLIYKKPNNEFERVKACYYKGDYLSSDLSDLEISPGSQKEFHVYLTPIEIKKNLKILSSYVIDQTNKQYHGNHNSQNNLKVPEIHKEWIE